MIFVSGPGHGGPAVVGNTYLEGTYSEVYPNISQDEAGLKKLFKQFSFPGGIPSHASPECPGSIHEGGELGYSLSHSFGAVFDNPDLIVACVVGDGEAETGPLATAWHSNKFLDPATDGAVLPILHLNGYKIANPTVLARIEPEELEQFLRGCGWTPYFVEGDDPALMHEAMASTLDRVVEQIRAIQHQARVNADLTRPRWPMIVLRSPKGWTGPKWVDGQPSRRQLPRTPGAHCGGCRPSRTPQATGRLAEELPPGGTVRRPGPPATGTGRAGALGRAPHGCQSTCQRRHAAARSDHAGLSGLRGEGAVTRGRDRGRHARAWRLPARCGQTQSRPTQFPYLWPRRDAVQPLERRVRGHQPAVGRTDPGQRRISRPRWPGHGDAERASVRRLA